MSILRSEQSQLVFSSLRQKVSEGRIIPLVGSGASMPTYKSWTAVLEELLSQAIGQGRLTLESDINFLSSQIIGDPLEAANSIEQAIGSPQFRSALGRIFKSTGTGTPVDERIIALEPGAIVTTNYDDGLECIIHGRGRLCQSFSRNEAAMMTMWRQGGLLNKDRPAILHWHGVSTRPEAMIFTATDYNQLYASSEDLSVLSDLWRDQQLLAIGFGFNDPFLTRLAEAAARGLLSENRHYALIGVEEGNEISPLRIRQFSDKYRLSPLFYTVRNEGRDHSELARILTELSTDGSQAPVVQEAESRATMMIVPAEGFSSSQHVAFEAGLLAINGRRLYVDSPLYVASSDGSDFDEAPEETTVAEIIRQIGNTAIVTRPEYGASTLGRRIASELAALGRPVELSDATLLSPYKAKLVKQISPPSSLSGSVLILDAFSPDEHERLLKEVIALGLFERYLLMVRSDTIRSVDSLNAIVEENKFSVVRLGQLTTRHIRPLLEVILDSSDDQRISEGVKKVYHDLLALCIPLTPANVIMYGTILSREDDFVPLNRVQIVEKYLHDILRFAGDDIRGSFTARNRVDVVSAYVNHLFSDETRASSEQEWFQFCSMYKREQLVAFNEAAAF